jgi:hypothetical protein
MRSRLLALCSGLRRVGVLGVLLIATIFVAIPAAIVRSPQRDLAPP